jgi:hypothetical protein
MRDFDHDADSRRAQRIDPENLQFTINGETFKVVSGYAPEAPGSDSLAEWRNTDFSELTDPEFGVLADRTIAKFLKPGQQAAWERARNPDVENPITGFDLVDIVGWLIESVVHRPLELSSGSSTGSTSPTQDSPQPAAQIGKHLTAVSRSPEGKASGA